MRNFQPHCLLDTQTQAVAVDVSRHIVQALSVEQSLWIHQAFAHLLDAAVNVTAHNVDLLNQLAFN